MKSTVIDAATTGYVLTDGAMGTELLRRGLPIGASTASWNLENPDAVKAVHEEYLHAGSECITTNSFSANRFRLEEHGLAARAAELNSRAVELARAVAGDRAWVLGSVGPCSGFATPREGLLPNAMQNAYVEQIAALSRAGVDALLFETVTDSAELRAAIEAAREVAPSLPVIVSLCFQRLPGGGGFHLIRTGESLHDACALLEKLNVAAAGCNCGSEVHMEDYATIVAALRAAVKGPILVRPNGGQAPACGAEVTCAEPPELMADGVWGLVRAGATILGGCCGTTPEHIRLFRQELDKL
jgi:methionine synthase I (cobalamin-dependent)